MSRSSLSFQLADLLSLLIIMQSQLKFKSDYHNVYTEEVNKIALNSSDNKDYKHLMELQHIHMVQMLLKYVKAK